MYLELLLRLLQLFAEGLFFFPVLVDHLLGQRVLLLHRHHFDRLLLDLFGCAGVEFFVLGSELEQLGL